MNQGQMVLIGIYFIALYCIMLNLKKVIKNENSLLKILCLAGFVLSAFRYVTLIIYSVHARYETLVFWRYFYFTTYIGLSWTMLSAVWYITPCYREKITYKTLGLLFLPWCLFGLWLIVGQPTRIVAASDGRYVLELTGAYRVYLTWSIGGFTVMLSLLCTVGFLKYKSIQLRAQFLVMSLACLVLMIDGIRVLRGEGGKLPVFTVSEVLGFLAVYYSLALPVKWIKKNEMI